MGDTILILYGDVPLTSERTLKDLVAKVREDNIALLTVTLDDPTGYGRIVRNENGKVTCIVEQKDANEDQLAIREVNTGIMAVKADLLRDMLARIDNKNAQGEYYLTDVIGLAVDEGKTIVTWHPEHEYEVAGVNSRVQLAELERVYQKNHATKLMESGVTLANPDTLTVRGDISVGQDIFIDSNVTLEGDVSIEDFVQIGQGCVISNASIGMGVVIKPYSVIENTRIEAQVEIGPFARVRPGTELLEKSKVGNFCEIKNSTIGAGSKVNHLSYIGDTTMGDGVNVGAGTITANYDGANKHRTVIGDNASTGANSVMVAPVNVGAGATLGAGTVLTTDAPDGELTIARAKQRTVVGWKRPEKSKK